MICCGKETGEPRGITGGRDRSGIKHQGRWIILTSQCAECGMHYAVEPDKLTIYQKQWLERRNKMVKNP